MKQNKNTKKDALDLYNMILNGEMSLEQAAKVLTEYPIIVKKLADMVKEDAKQQKRFQKQSIRALISRQAIVWSDNTATPEHK